MDRNEKKNSFRNVQNSRGNDREAKKYKRTFHITLAVAVVLAASTGGLGFTTYRLSRDEAKNQESGTDPVVVENEAGGDGTDAKTTPNPGDVTPEPKATATPGGTVTPEASGTTAPEENAADVIEVTVTNSLGSDIDTIDIREAGTYENDSEGWKSDLWNGTFPFSSDGNDKYSVKLNEFSEKQDRFDIQVNGGAYRFRDLTLKSIKKIELKLDNGQDGRVIPYAEYEDESGNTVNTFEDAKKIEDAKKRVSDGDNTGDTGSNTGTADISDEAAN